MLHSIRMGGLVLAFTMMGSSLALAQNGYHYYDRDDYGYNRSSLRIARNTGYDDGSRMAYSDFRHGKPFNPYPRGKYSHEDHGYHREYGDKYAYREAYERGYRAGYQSAFRRY